MLIQCWGWAALSLLLVSGSILGFGLAVSALSPRLLRDRPLSLASAIVLGLGISASISLGLGMLGAYTLAPQTALVCLGLILLVIYRRELSTVWRFRPWGYDALWLIFPAAYFIARFVSSGVPQQHSDPLYYHLSAPKLWSELGQIKLFEEHPSYSQATLWEVFYGIPMIWFGTKDVSSLITSQLFGQWMHAIWGQIGCVLVGAAILSKFGVKARPGLRVFVAWLCTALPAFEWLGCLAKNDCILMLFVLAATLEALETRFFLSGLLIGFAYATKPLAVWAGLGLLALVPSRLFPRYFAGGFLGIALIVLRNLIWAKNPVFPALDDKLGAHWISQGWMNHNLSYAGMPELHGEMLRWLREKLLHKPLPKILLFVSLIGVASRFWREKNVSAVRLRWGAFLCIQLLLCLTMLRFDADGRYANFVAALWLLSGMGVALAEGIQISALKRYAWLPLALCALGINIPLDVLGKIPKHYLFGPADHYAEQFHAVYDMQKWVRETIPKDKRILFLAEKQQYFLDRPFETVVEMKKWEEILEPLKNRAELFMKARELGYDYIHFSPQAGGFPVLIRPYWAEIVEAQELAIFRSPNSLVFKLY